MNMAVNTTNISVVRLAFNVKNVHHLQKPIVMFSCFSRSQFSPLALMAACNDVPGNALAQVVPFINPAPEGVTNLIAAFMLLIKIKNCKKANPVFFIRHDFILPEQTALYLFVH
jgi:hypothetical protein